MTLYRKGKTRALDRSLLLILALAITMAGCQRDQPTQWDVNMRAPLVEGRITWADLVEDTLLEEENGTLHLRYESALINFKLDSLTNLQDTVLSTRFTPGFSGGPLSIPPGTNVFNQTDDLNFGISSAEIREVHISRGRLNYRIESYVEGPLAVSYALPGVALPEGGYFSLETITEPAQDDVPFVTTGSRDLQDVQVDLQGSDGGVFNRLATSLNVAIAAEAADAVPVYGDDSIRVELAFEDVVIAYGRGFFGQFSDISSDTIDVSPFTETLGYIDFDELSFSVSITNRVGADAQLELNSIRAERNLESVELNHELTNQTINLTRAVDQGNGNVNANTYDWLIDEGNSNITQLFGLLPQRLVIDRMFELNPLGDISGGNDFIYADQPVEASFNIDVPLAFSTEGVILRDTLQLEPLESEVEGEGELHVQLSNGFPLQVDQLKLTLLSEGEEFELLSDLSLSAASWDGEMYQTLPVEHTQSLSNAHLNALRTGGVVEIEVQFETYDGEEVTMNGNESIEVEIIGSGLIQVEIE